MTEFENHDRRASAIEYGAIAALIASVIIGGATLAGGTFQESSAKPVPVEQTRG